MLQPVAAPAESPGAPLPLFRRALVEGLGTAFLLAGVVGSGILGERLSGGNAGLALLVNSLATGAILVALILGLGPLSGAHLNPAVTLADVVIGDRSGRELAPYVVAQVVGAVAGVAAAEAMFVEPLFAVSHKPRSGAGQVLGEIVATFGLLVVAVFGARRSVEAAAIGVGSYIAAAYWFTSSTSFANPAVTLARSLTDSFTGILPTDVPGFLLGQAAGLVVFLVLARWLDFRKE